MNFLDIIIIVIYSLGLLGLGYYFKGQADRKEYFLGGDLHIALNGNVPPFLGGWVYPAKASRALGSVFSTRRAEEP